MPLNVLATSRNPSHETLHAWIKVSSTKKSKSHGRQLPPLQSQSLDRYHGNQRLKYLANCITRLNHPRHLLSHLGTSQFFSHQHLKNIPSMLSKPIKSCSSQVNNPLLPSYAAEPLSWNPNLDILKTPTTSNPTLLTLNPQHISPKIPPQLHLTIAKTKTHKLRHNLHNSSLALNELLQNILRKNPRRRTIGRLVLDIRLSVKQRHKTSPVMLANR